jgi:regulator of Ty1 transposition protein 109
VNSLLSHLQTTFDKLPNPHKVSLTVLASSPKRTTSLFPYTVHHPRCFQVDYLVTLGCDVKDGPSRGGDSADSTRPSFGEGATHGPVDKKEEQDHNSQNVGEEKVEKGTSHVLTTALSAHLYILPLQKTSILYISKLDSSGYPTTPLPLTKTFITSILSYFLLPQNRPTPTMRTQLFARSQGQYLFPNSAEGPKKVLGGLGLCGWWKGVYEDVAAAASGIGGVKLGMVLPGYSAGEAQGMLGQRKPLPPGMEWTSTPPFHDTPLASSSSSTTSSSAAQDTFTRPSLADWIPSLPDDPKARFLDDLVSDGAEDPTRRRNMLKPKDPSNPGSSSSSIQTQSSTGPSSSSQKKDGHRARVQAEDEAERRFTSSTLERVSKEEYWERMGFRQECISGDVTGFFSLESTISKPGLEAPIPMAPPTVSPVPTTTASVSSSSALGPSSSSGSGSGSGSGILDPKATRTSLPPSIVERVTAALVNTDFKTYELAIEHTAIWVKSVKALVTDELGEEGWRGCHGTVEAKAGAGAAANGGEGNKAKREEAPVTILQVRKKKKV